MTEPRNPADMSDQEIISSIKTLSKLLLVNGFSTHIMYNALYVRYTTELLKREGIKV